jgi:dUTP pyrophosphatase
MIELKIKMLDDGLPTPRYQHDGDAGLDLPSRVDCRLEPGARARVPTGVAVAIPRGYAGFVMVRSGLAARHGISCVNSPGLIDAGYRGEVIVAVVNLDRDDPVVIEPGDRIAQLVVIEVPEVEPVWATELPQSERGAGGFGSTGRS